MDTGSEFSVGQPVPISNVSSIFTYRLISFGKEGSYIFSFTFGFVKGLIILGVDVLFPPLLFCVHCNGFDISDRN